MGVQIRNAASVGGNIVTGSPISDLNPLYMALGATFTVVGQGTPERQVCHPCWMPLAGWNTAASDSTHHAADCHKPSE